MLSKEVFSEYMDELKRIIDDSYQVSIALKRLSPDFGGFANDRAERIIIDLLKIVMNDTGKYSDIDYFIYELEWGTKYEKGCYSEAGIDIPLRTVDDLWDRLTVN